MTTDQDARLLLARIDERVKAIMEDVADLRRTRRCHTHSEKLRNLERVVYGLMMVSFGLLGRAIYELLS
ncbi:hypothetical protein [Desulfovibrio ferrophilus]|uniref:Uncharacterized protein n=1 Tax=Desulfovibrio ferrophilus TaxID=241368 RepID=A0A2Z6AZY1_9BACT|nr:hypothetical protein [Desulfovibrio ferrophilus]BBD08760.1 uncharacterized protein DFE_2034 [Desulfovibrio ferrophilus]